MITDTPAEPEQVALKASLENHLGASDEKSLNISRCNQVSPSVEQTQKEEPKSTNPILMDSPQEEKPTRIESPECSHNSFQDEKKSFPSSTDTTATSTATNITTATTTTTTTTTYAPTSANAASQSVPQENFEHLLLKAQRDLESMVLKYARSERENLQNKYKADELDKKLKRAIKDNDQLANRIKLLTNDKYQLTDTLNAKVAQLTVLEQKNSYLNNVQGVKLKDYEETIKKLEVTNEELLTLIDSYKSKEGELLDFSERLSMKHMMLQSELDEALKKVPNYKDQYEECLKERSELIQAKEELNKKLEALDKKLKLEQEHSDSLRVERDENEANYRNQLDQLQNEIKLIRRKHLMATKELMKEIKHLKARLEKFDPILSDVDEDRSSELVT